MGSGPASMRTRHAEVIPVDDNPVLKAVWALNALEAVLIDVPKKTSLPTKLTDPAESDRMRAQQAALFSLHAVTGFLHEFDHLRPLAAPLEMLLLELDNVVTNHSPSQFFKPIKPCNASTNQDKKIKAAALSALGILIVGGMPVGAALDQTISDFKSVKVGREGRNLTKFTLKKWRQQSSPTGPDQLSRRAIKVSVDEFRRKGGSAVDAARRLARSCAQ